MTTPRDVGEEAPEPLELEAALLALGADAFADLFTHAPVPLVCLDRERRIASASVSAHEVLRYGPGELEGITLDELLPEARRADLDRQWRELWRKGVWRERLQFRRRDGVLVDFGLVASAQLDDRGKLAYARLALIEQSDTPALRETLRRTDAALKYLFVSNPRPMWIYDLQTLQYLDVNAAAIAQYGWTRQEFLSMRITDVRPAEDVERLLEIVGRRRSSMHHAGTWRHRLKDGRIIEVEIVSQLFEHEGRPAALVLVQDITERRRAEGDLRRHVSLLQATLEATADGILVVGNDRRIVARNRRFGEMWRLPESLLAQGEDDDVLGAVIGQLRDPQGFLSKVRDVYERPDEDSMDVLEFLDGRTFERYSTPQRLDGAPVGRVWSFRDVTERNRVEEALRHERERFRRLSDAAFEGILFHDQGRILEANRAFATLAGYPSEQLAGMAILDLVDPQSRELVARHLLVPSDETYEVVMRRRDGTTIDVEVAGKTVPYDRSSVRVTAVRDISDRKRAAQQLEFHTNYDGLTGLPNRTLFRERLAVALAQASRHDARLAVLFADLDHFKLVNDSYGHETGDRLLQAVGERLRRALPEDRTVARGGADGFLVLLTDLVDVDEPGSVCRRILRLLEEPVRLFEQEIYATASIGVALFPGDGGDAETVLKNAESAMYRAKEMGRNNFQFCSPELHRRATERLALEGGLRRAVERGELELHYQPIYDLAAGGVVAMEALLRWRHPERGMLSPAVFIPLAEESGLILPIGHWVLATACRQAVAWDAAGHRGIRMAVNLSAFQFQQPDLAERIDSALRASGLAPGALELEITETAAMRNAEATIATLRTLKNMGVRIAIDDFGTGHSSLSYLKKFPIDSVKIDQTFVRDVCSDSADAAIVSAAIAMAHRMNLEVVAEGVETAEQVELLRRESCDMIQGFLCSRPVPASEAQAALSLRIPS